MQKTPHNACIEIEIDNIPLIHLTVFFGRRAKQMHAGSAV
jgi:hypothetical protein